MNNEYTGVTRQEMQTVDSGSKQPNPTRTKHAHTSTHEPNWRQDTNTGSNINNDDVNDIDQ